VRGSAPFPPANNQHCQCCDATVHAMQYHGCTRGGGTHCCSASSPSPSSSSSVSSPSSAPCASRADGCGGAHAAPAALASPRVAPVASSPASSSAPLLCDASSSSSAGAAASACLCPPCTTPPCARGRLTGAAAPVLSIALSPLVGSSSPTRRRVQRSSTTMRQQLRYHTSGRGEAVNRSDIFAGLAKQPLSD
jgi:hypothetical protein